MRSATVVTNFYNYLLHHNVCREYEGQLHAAKAVCATAAIEIPALYELVATLPGPFNRACSTKGGPYTYGPYPASGSAVVQQYGVMNVADDGAELTVSWSGYSADGTLRMSHSFKPIIAQAPAPVVFFLYGEKVREKFYIDLDV